MQLESDEDEGKVLGSYDKCAFVGTDAPEAGHMQGKLIGGYLVMDFDKIGLKRRWQDQLRDVHGSVRVT